MGQPKQLLPYRGQILLGHVIQCALASSCSPVVVVLGAHADKIAPEIAHFPIEIVNNSDWNQGMSSSIQCGLNYLKDRSIEGIVFLTCDQPFISTDIIEQLIDLYTQSNKAIIASQYGEIIGIPALFTRSAWPELIQLKGDSGAKSIIQKNRDRVATIKFFQGRIDLDTPAEYQQFISERNVV
ncbi:MAG: nucleotidyltransferase family protein [Leptolyngbya sp. SIO1E4]|nr:nucleotidyltransferase family protein [Leptolyngbya sp. SIO1E4]